MKALSISEYAQQSQVAPEEPDLESASPGGASAEIDKEEVDIKPAARTDIELGTAAEEEGGNLPAAGAEVGLAEGRLRCKLDGAAAEETARKMYQTGSTSHQMGERDATLTDADPEVTEARDSQHKLEQARNPWGDAIIWMSGVGYFCLGFTMVMAMLVLPLMLSEDKFGLDGEYGSLKRGEDVAKIIGLVSIPQGLFGFVCQSFLYLYLSNAGWSDRYVLIPLYVESV